MTQIRFPLVLTLALLGGCSRHYVSSSPLAADALPIKCVLAFSRDYPNSVIKSAAKQKTMGGQEVVAITYEEEKIEYTAKYDLAGQKLDSY